MRFEGFKEDLSRKSMLKEEDVTQRTLQEDTVAHSRASKYSIGWDKRGMQSDQRLAGA